MIQFTQVWISRLCACVLSMRVSISSVRRVHLTFQEFCRKGAYVITQQRLSGRHRQNALPVRMFHDPPCLAFLCRRRENLEFVHTPSKCNRACCVLPRRSFSRLAGAGKDTGLCRSRQLNVWPNHVHAMRSRSWCARLVSIRYTTTCSQDDQRNHCLQRGCCKHETESFPLSTRLSFPTFCFFRHCMTSRSQTRSLTVSTPSNVFRVLVALVCGLRCLSPYHTPVSHAHCMLPFGCCTRFQEAVDSNIRRRRSRLGCRL